MVSSFFYVHPYLRGNDPIWLIFFKWVESIPTSWVVRVFWLFLKPTKKYRGFHRFYTLSRGGVDGERNRELGPCSLPPEELVTWIWWFRNLKQSITTCCLRAKEPWDFQTISSCGTIWSDFPKFWIQHILESMTWKSQKKIMNILQSDFWWTWNFGEHVPGDSIRDLFGMVKFSDPFKGLLVTSN